MTKFSTSTHNNLTDIVVEHINNLLKKYKINKSKIKKIFVTIGPGSFTGVRVGILIAKTWSLINRTHIYIIDSLWLQLPKNSGLSILDARGTMVYVAVYKNRKCIMKPTIITEQKAELLIKTYKNLGVYIQYKSVNVFDNLIHHLHDFTLVRNINTLIPLYVKKAV
ncbi:MAG: tRNA (adenosine(37)-N6)-threonylcarbamoyltransferase complex dimerization subunit type 1 TsaB [Mycoplasmataceae bacterium]|nr:tRNA (adenosine(37)-N6)-threonylcarbamoyltransferase complex dimerization subunit type 1 TsaB [Mycoplasmataceae bacterium]